MATLKSISDIFERRVFRIPDYQRGYSWSKKQLNDFWEDIENLPNEKMHYTGVLTLEPVSKNNSSLWEDDSWLISSSGKGFKPFYVVDGQQRLTTTIILIQAILEKLSDQETLNYMTKKEIAEKYIFQSADGEISKSFIFGYEKDNPSYEFLKTQIFGESSNSNQDIETVYTTNLEKAKTFFAKKIEEFDLNKLSILYKKATNLLKFNEYIIEDDSLVSSSNRTSTCFFTK